MEISGKIIQVLPLQTGVAKNSGNPWQSQSYVLETQEQFPKRVCFEVFGEQRIKDNPCQLDDIVTVSFDIESREFNGRWYTSIRAWRIQQGVVDGTAPAAAPAPAAPATPAQPQAAAPAEPAVQPFDPTVDDNTTDLPF
ncbi:MAG: DUF3127 domain-containing protein [Paludibacteraceae bacterium]|jgi:hypothetical protein|nr:DUF3127 domain-containing protein [Paludibacteraceae bacterium]MBR1716335.1 DUF3127 domain-containing protein [Paludibacteraceae bacterium]